jgi:phage N-6-adenine-methyltransferase
MKHLAAHFSRKSDEYETPWELFNELDRKHGPITLDVCATAEKAKCAAFYSPADDGLAQPWTGTCWMNPPFSAIADWVAQADEAAKAGATVVCLLPVRTDTRWWHAHVAHHEIEFRKGRVKFAGAKSGAPFPSAVVVMRPPPAPGAGGAGGQP